MKRFQSVIAAMGFAVLGANVSVAAPITSFTAGALSQTDVDGTLTQTTAQSPPTSLPLSTEATDGFGGQAIASVVGGGESGPSVTASAASLGGSLISNQEEAEADLTYAFYIEGPAGAVETNVQSALSVHASDLGTGFAQASFKVGNGIGLIYLDLECQTPGGLAFGMCSYATNDAKGDFGGDLFLPTNQLIFVSMSTLVTTNTFDASANGAVDPTFTIDPSTPDADQYSFVFPDGISNGTSEVPEPGSLAILTFGLAGLFGFRHRLPWIQRATPQL